MMTGLLMIAIPTPSASAPHHREEAVAIGGTRCGTSHGRCPGVPHERGSGRRGVDRHEPAFGRVSATLLVPALIALNCLVGILPAASQGVEAGVGTVSGRTFDLQSGRPIPNAYVRVQAILSGDVKSVASDSAGRFTAVGLPSGAYVVRARTLRGGHGEAIVPVHVGPGTAVQLDLYLPPPAFNASRHVAQLDEMEAHRRAWKSERDDSYRFDATPSCFCLGGRWTLAVSSDTTRVVRAPVGAGAPPRNLINIDSVFSWLSRELHDPARIVTVSYHPTLGYPTSIHTDVTDGSSDAWFALRIDRVRRARGSR
jgi:hypothetical protein